MCVVHKPQIPQNPDDENKPLPVLRNPFLDGMLGNIAAMRNGRDSLRIPLNPLGIPVGGPGGTRVGGSGSGSGASSVGGSSGGSTSGGTTGGGGQTSGSVRSAGGGTFGTP